MSKLATLRWPLLAAVAVATVIAVVVAGGRDDAPSAPSDGRIGRAIPTPRRAAPDPSRPLSAAPAAERAAAFVWEHPVSPALRDALVGVAALADALRAPIDADDEADVAAARQTRRERQRELRARMRDALREMSAAERARMRALHVNVITLARHVTAHEPT